MRSKLALSVILLSLQLLTYHGVTTCPSSVILTETLNSGQWTYNLESYFPSIPTTQTFQAFTIGWWMLSSISLTNFIQFEGDGNKNRISLDFLPLSSNPIAAKVVTDQTTLSSQTVTIDPTTVLSYWAYISFAIDYQLGSFYLYTWTSSTTLFTGSLYEPDASTELTLPFTSTDSWSVTTSGSKIYICGTSSSCGSYSLAALTVFLGTYLNQAAHFQRYTNQISPWVNFVFSSSESATEQVSAKTFNLGVAPAPSYDASTDSLHFPANGRYLKWPTGKVFTTPLRMITILMRLRFNLGTDCGYQKIFSRKTASGTELYSFGFSSSIAPGSLIFSYNWIGNYQAAVPGTSVFNNDYFHTIAISTIFYDPYDSFVFVVSVNSSTPTASPSTSSIVQLITLTYAELTTDEFWIGDNTCSFQGKLEYFSLWNNGGMNNQMDCLTGCSFTLGTLSDQMTCLDVCHPSCLTCDGNLNTDCLSCQSGRLRYNPNSSDTFQCIVSCPTGFYPSQDNTECLSCDSSCLSCTNGTACLQCKSTYPLKVSASASLCYSTCPAKTYEDTGLGKCLDCDSSCSSCSGPSSQECTSCHAGYYLDLVTPMADSGSCAKCDPSCNTCLGSTGNDCTSCNPPLILNGSSCQINSASTPNSTKTTNATTGDSKTQDVTTVPSTILTTMSFAPTAAAVIGEFVPSSVSSFTSGISIYNLYSYLALIKIASLFVLINLPFRQRVLDFFKATIASQVFPNFFSKAVEDSADKQFTDGAFSRIIISGQFILNYGSYMSQQTSFLLIAVLSHFLTHLLRKNSKVSAVLSKITAALYNTVIIYLTGSEIPFLIGLVATIISGSYKDGACGIAGLILMILVICIWLGFFAFVAILLFKGESLKTPKEATEPQRHSRRNKVSLNISLKEILSKGLLAPFVSDRLQRQLALPLKFIKILCVTMLIGMSQSYPLLQIIPALILEFGWLILDAWSDSKKSKVDFAFNLLENFFVLVSFIASLLIDVVDVEVFDYLLIGMLSSALIFRTIHVIVGLIGAAIISIRAKKQPAKAAKEPSRRRNKSPRVTKRSTRQYRLRLDISEAMNSSKSPLSDSGNRAPSESRSPRRLKQTENRNAVSEVYIKHSRRRNIH